MGCCGSKQTGGANAFYGDGDIKDNSSEAEERQSTPKPTRAPSRAPSRADLFYNDGDEVKEETTSWFGSKSKSSKSSKGVKGKAKNRGTKDEDSPKFSRRKSGNAGSSATNKARTAGGGRAGGSRQDPQSTSQIAPEATLFYRNQRVDNILDSNPRQRAMQDSYDEQKEEQRRQRERAEEDKKAYLEKYHDDKEKSSCFAGLCKPKRVGASNFHNQ